MKIWVTGAEGVLGREVAMAAEVREHEVLTTTHVECPIDSLASVIRIAQVAGPDVIINCAGSLPGAPSIDMVTANTLGPHILACLAPRGIRIVHMSTDCVFSGQESIVPSSSYPPDPTDLYGRTKLAGEVQAERVLNVRGSFISKQAGFLRWLRHAEFEVEAWDNTTWTGTTVEIMAATLVELAEGSVEGVVHVASPTMVTKGWMVELFVRELELPVVVTHTKSPYIRRALRPDIVLPDVARVLVDYAKEMHRCH